MFRLKVLGFATIAVVVTSAIPETVEAGPLLDWLRGRRCCRQRCAQPVYPVTVASPCANNCTTTCTQTCQRTVVNYVPCTAYRTSWECVPVTSYRPQSRVDPCTGCTVTCMRPCTTYTYRARQVPYTTYRPVYSTQTYQVPVTYTSQMPAGCNTCGVAGAVQPVTNVPPITGTLSTNGTYTTNPSVGQPTPAASTQPSLNPQVNQRPIIIEQPSPAGSTSRLNPPQNWPTNSNVTPVKDPQPLEQWEDNPPQLFEEEAKTAQSPVYKQFNYTPVRFASSAEVNLSDANASGAQEQRVYYGTVKRSGTKKVNQGWRSLAK